jgi:hypothetical protein
MVLSSFISQDHISQLKIFPEKEPYMSCYYPHQNCRNFRLPGNPEPSIKAWSDHRGMIEDPTKPIFTRWTACWTIFDANFWFDDFDGILHAV